MLFLGSGSTILCKDSEGNRGLDGKGLAKEILKDLNNDTEPPFNVSLMEAAEFYSAVRASARRGLDDLICDLLSDLMPTIGHYIAAAFPWCSVITTNYNTVVEDAWGTANAAGYSIRHAISIGTDSALGDYSGNNTSMRIYKPHGCINNQGDGNSQPPELVDTQRLIITSNDYYRSQNIRKEIYNEIKKDAAVSTMLFIGYSLEDYTFRNMFYQLHSLLATWNSKSYSVGPDDQPLRFQWRSESVRENFKSTLVNDNFDTFMLRLTIAQGYVHPKLRSLIKDKWAEIENENTNTIGGLKLSDITNLPDPPLYPGKLANQDLHLTTSSKLFSKSFPANKVFFINVFLAFARVK